MSTQMLWQMILHSTSLTMATGVLLPVKRRRRIDQDRRRRVDHPLGVHAYVRPDWAPIDAGSSAALFGSCASIRGDSLGIDMNLSLDADRERSLGWER